MADTGTCEQCGAAAPGGARCEACEAKAARSRRFFFVRVSVLLCVLFGVLLYAYHDVRKRSSRREWERTLEVAVVLLRHGAVDDEAIAALGARLPALSAVLEAEMKRYRPAARQPFAFTFHGPVAITEPPPSPPDEAEGLKGLVLYNYDLWRYLSKIDALAGVEPGRRDARIYLVATPPSGRRKMIEGASEPGGRVGVVGVELDETMVDLALFVAAHELFHTLGAADRYDATGAIMVPDGLADPAQVPLYPQAQAELMARHRALTPSSSEPPSSLDELAVGPATAREIGWLGPAR